MGRWWRRRGGDEPEDDGPAAGKSPLPDLPTDWRQWDVPEERVELAGEVATNPDFGVEEPGEFEEGDLVVRLYDDVRGMVGDTAIEALPGWLVTLAGVDEAEHLEREHIHVFGSISNAQLAAAVVARLATTGDPDYWDEQ